MGKLSLDAIRNVALLSHSGAGKTTLAEAVLFTAGAIDRFGSVDSGSTASDFDADEIKRKISINLSVLPLTWKNTKVNILDAPGYFDFVGDTKAAVRVATCGMIIINATSGPEVGTEMAWKFCEERKLPRTFFLSKMDRENISFDTVIEKIRAKFGNRCVPLQVPIGSGDSFRGVVSLVDLKAHIGYPEVVENMPPECQEMVNKWQEKMVEAAAEATDELMEKYLNGETLSREEIVGGLRKAILDGSIFPIYVGSALKNIGIAALLDAIVEDTPTLGTKGFHLNGEIVIPQENSPVTALVFKTTADPYVGKLTYFRVYNGELKSNSTIRNQSKGVDERIGQLLAVRGKTQTPVDSVVAGDIGAIAKLATTTTCDILGEGQMDGITYPKPIFNVAVHPKTKADLDKMGQALSRLSEEDPTIRVFRDNDTNETIISGMGDTHVDVTIERAKRKFGIDVDLSTPKVSYKETVTSTGKGDYKHKKQSGGHGQYGHVVLEISPLERGAGIVFENNIVGGAIPKNYIPAVEKGMNEFCGEGVLANCPVVDFKVNLYDGSFHPVDSSEICFKIAANQALKKAMSDARPVLLEPIMKMQIIIPNEYTGNVVSDLNTKRAQVLGMNPDGDTNTIEALAPLAEISRYAIDLKSLTQGRGSFSMELDHYDPVPQHITQVIVEKAQKEKAETAS